MPHQSHAYQPATRIVGGGLALAAVALGIQVGLPDAAPPASASSTLLCVGFSSCASKGYSDSGYHAHWGHMYWQMYSGRNCVNYAAYRMVAAGLPDRRPWSGSGNAMNWGRAMSSITNRTPTPGSIAWWNSNAPGAGSLGHVAYVERVVSPTEIIVSESNWGSDFDWRVVTSSMWPSGFIHFHDAVMRNTVRPVVTGGPQRVLGTFHVTPGSWSIPNPTLHYQWLADGVPIPGYRGTSFRPNRDFLGKRISVQVVATAPGYRAVGTVTPQTFPLAPGLLMKLADPTVTGTPEVDSPLTAAGGVFKPGVASKTFQWYADGVAIPGATDRTFTPGQDQIGKKISAVVTGTRDGFESRSLATTPVGPVIAKELTLTRPGSVSGTPRVGQTLRAASGSYAPRSASVRYRWLRDGAPITGAIHSTYVPSGVDAGHRLSVQVTLAHKGYRDNVKTYSLPGVVTTTPALGIVTTGLAGAARIHVRVSAPGVSAPSGIVTILVGKHATRARLVDGATTVLVDGLFRGLRRVKVSYAGAGSVLPTSKMTTVRVAPKSKAGTSAIRG